MDVHADVDLGVGIVWRQVSEYSVLGIYVVRSGIWMCNIWACF